MDISYDLEDSPVESEHISTVPASFSGRLDLASFTYSTTNAVQPKAPSQPSPRSSTPRKSARSPLKRTSTPTSSCPSPSKKLRRSSSYAPPTTYAHLPELRDVLEPSLICVFIGLNPGITTSTTGHAYAHPSNLFWKLLHSSGCTDRRCRPEEDGDLPRLFALGNTNIVARPTRNGSELSKAEMDASVHVLEEKMRRFKPESVCVVGKSIWESIWRVRYGRKMGKGEFRYGWQEDRWCGDGDTKQQKKGEGLEDEKSWEGCRVFVATSTSGLAASVSRDEKERIWKELGSWVEERRRHRALQEAAS